MAYEVKRCSTCRTLWVIKKNGKIVSHHDDRNEAQETAQRLVEDDRWNAANRD